MLRFLFIVTVRKGNWTPIKLTKRVPFIRFIKMHTRGGNEVNGCDHQGD